MGKSKTTVPAEQRRFSRRLAAARAKAPPVEIKKRAPPKAPKAQKPKPAENGSTKAEEPKTDAAEAK